MINIVMWLKEEKNKEKISMACARNSIRIVESEFENISDFLTIFSELDTNIDVLVISHEMLAETDINEFVGAVRETEPNLRIVIVFPGYRNQYIEPQVKEYANLGIPDIIYEGQYLDEEFLVEVIRKGFVYDYDVNVYDEPGEKLSAKETPKKCITVGVLGITHGAGVTNMVVNIANYISLSEECSVKAVDFSGTGSLRFPKGRKVTYIVHSDVDIPRLKKNNRAIIYDFGTPYNISAKGKHISGFLTDEQLKLFQQCDLKILMSFSDAFLKEAFEIKELCKKYNVPFVINDNVDITINVNADGIHIGQNDTEVGLVRSVIGENKILGVSAQTVEQAILAEKMGADYLGVGAVFSTGSKADADDVSHKTLKEICENVSIPVVAIGGIGVGNILELKGKGIHGVAVISAIFAANNIKKATSELKELAKKVICDD